MEKAIGNSVETVVERPHIILSKRRRQAVTAGVMLGLFLAALEATVVATAMPTVISSLGGLDHYSWVFSAYLLSSTVTVPVWGRLSDLFGRRPLFIAGIGIFLIGSALSGVSATMTQLILFRALQGLGAGALVPLSLTINGEIYTVRERTKMQGYFSGVWGLASIVGPLAGGFITDHLTWRWVFYINIPFGLAAAIIVWLCLVEPARHGKAIIDYAGAAWLAISITLLLVGLVESGNPGMLTNPWLLAPFAGFVAFGALFIRTERRAAEPIVPFSLFQNRIVSVGSIMGVMIGTAMYGAISFIPLFVQGTLGGTATEAGSVLTPFLLGWVILSVVGGKLMLRIGYRPTVIAGLILLAASFAGLSTFGSGTPRVVLLTDMAIMGCGMGLSMLALLITTQNSVPRKLLGIATSMSLFSRTIGGAIGVAMMGAVLTAGLMHRVPQIQRDSGLPEAEVVKVVQNPSVLMQVDTRVTLKPQLLAAMQTGLAGALHNVFLLGGLFGALALISGFWLPAVATMPTEVHTGLMEEVVHPESVEECERLLMTEMGAMDDPHALDVLDQPPAVPGD